MTNKIMRLFDFVRQIVTQPGMNEEKIEALWTRLRFDNAVESFCAASGRRARRRQQNLMPRIFSRLEGVFHHDPVGAVEALQHMQWALPGNDGLQDSVWRAKEEKIARLFRRSPENALEAKLRSFIGDAVHHHNFGCGRNPERMKGDLEDIVYLATKVPEPLALDSWVRLGTALDVKDPARHMAFKEALTLAESVEDVNKAVLALWEIAKHGNEKQGIQAMEILEWRLPPNFGYCGPWNQRTNQPHP